MAIRFSLNDVEEKRAVAWMKRHWESAHDGVRRPLDAICTQPFTYCFTPTGIGDAVMVRCDVCRKKKNVTDYDCW